MTDPIRAAGADALANELYELACDLALNAAGELMLTEAQAAEMRARIEYLRPLVGDHLNTMLDNDDPATTH